MATKPILFISAVSKELRSTRDLVAKVLLSLGYDPEWQDLFGLEDGTVKEMLRRKIDAADGLIQLVGQCYGAESQTPDPDFGRVSYTQYEALYARQQKKRVWYLLLEDSFPADAHEPEIEDQRELQLAYRQRLQSEDHLFHNLVSGTDIELRLMRLRDELSHLRRKGKQWAALVLGLLVLCVLGVLWLKRGQSHTDASITKTDQKLDTVLQRYHQMEQALIKLADTETHARQPGDQLTPEQLRQRAYTLLEKELGIPAGMLSKELPGFALELYSRTDTAPMLRARAAYALNKFAEAEQLFVESDAQDQQALAKAQQTVDQLRAKRIEALIGAAQAAQSQVHYPQTLAHYQAALELTSPDHDFIAWLRLQNLTGYVYYLQGRYPEGLAHSTRIWQIAKQSGQGIDPVGLTAHMQYASALAENGRPAEAELEYRLVLQVQQRVLGPEHRNTVRTMSSLANALYDQAKYPAAEALNRTILALDERALGPEDPGTLMDRNNLANALKAQDKYAEAEAELQSVLTVKMRVLGDDDPSTLTTLNNLANVFYAQAKYADAEQVYRAVGQVQADVLGPEHPHTLGSRMNLALTLYSQKKFSAAEREHRAVLAIRERTLGINHPQVGQSCYNLALCLYEQAKLPDALAYMQRAEQIAIKTVGPKHPDYTDAKRNCERIQAAMK